MQYQSFLIKYAEIGTKGKNRYMFEDALIKQIRYALKSVEGQFDVTKESGRIYVKAETDYDYDDAVEALKRATMTGNTTNGYLRIFIIPMRCPIRFMQRAMLI